jgi:hypothetical protein
MSAQNVNLQPRDKGITGNKQKPPKPGDAAMLRARIENQIAAAPAAPVVQVEQGFSAQDFAETPPAPQPMPAPAPQVQEMPEPVRMPQHENVASPPPPVDPRGAVVSSNSTALLAPPIQPENKPPSTHAEFRQQQAEQFNPNSYPDVADIFTGKAGPLWKPNTGIIDVRAAQEAAMPPRPQALPPQEIVVKHELPDKALAYKAIRNFSCYLGSTMVSFFEGQVIYEISTIDQLLMGGCDSIVPVDTAENFIQCPACRHQFPAQLAFAPKPGQNLGMVAAMFPHH